MRCIRPPNIVRSDQKRYRQAGREKGPPREPSGAGRVGRRRKEAADMEFSRRLRKPRKRNVAAFFRRGAPDRICLHFLPLAENYGCVGRNADAQQSPGLLHLFFQILSCDISEGGCGAFALRNMVRLTGFEPALLAKLEPKSSVSANFTTGAFSFPQEVFYHLTFGLSSDLIYTIYIIIAKMP